MILILEAVVFLLDLAGHEVVDTPTYNFFVLWAALESPANPGTVDAILSTLAEMPRGLAAF